MIFGVLGLGSMGSRRVRDLLALGHEVHGFDVRADRNSRAAERFGIKTTTSLSDLLERRLDALVVSTPPDKHTEGYKAAFDARIPFFSEANILTPKTGWFAAQEARSGVRGYASATWRFYAPLVVLAERLATVDGATTKAIHHEYADYLPRWHPWENYWEFYAGARRQTCAAREMVPFELEWLCWLFGQVASVSAVIERLGEWRTDINDAYFLKLRFVSGLFATVRIELYRVASAREATVCGLGTSYRVDFNSDTLSQYNSEAGAWVSLPLVESVVASKDLEHVYAAEIAAFATSVADGAPYPKTWAEDRHLSDVLVAAEVSASEKRWVDIAEVSASYDGLALDWDVPS